ncbi:MAG: TIGR04255 family protein [Terriglobales bacterium]
MRSEHATVVQLRRGGFTFSKLRPYTAWEEVTAEALELWVRYAEVARPQRLTRLAVRYINDMTFPMAPAARYLSAPPVVPSPIPPKIGEFFSRVVILDQESNTTAILVQAQGPQPEPDRLRLLLDIDVFHQGQVPMDRESCAARMQSLRELKNAIFFANITEMAKKQFL